MREEDKKELQSELNRVTGKKEVLVMPFGKHKGKLLSEIQTGYLRWLVTNLALKDDLKAAVEREVAARPASMPGSDWYGRMPFGKHKGELLEDLPEDYILYLLENCKLQAGLRAALSELVR